MTPSASKPRTCPLSIRTIGASATVHCADAAPSIAAAVSRTAKKYFKFLCTRGSSQWGYENGDASSIFARSHRPVDGANVRLVQERPVWGVRALPLRATELAHDCDHFGSP